MKPVPALPTATHTAAAMVIQYVCPCRKLPRSVTVIVLPAESPQVMCIGIGPGHEHEIRGLCVACDQCRHVMCFQCLELRFWHVIDGVESSDPPIVARSIAEALERQDARPTIMKGQIGQA